MAYEHLYLRIPPELKERIDEQAHERRQSINQTAIEMLAAWFMSTPLEPASHGDTSEQ